MAGPESTEQSLKNNLGFVQRMNKSERRENCPRIHFPQVSIYFLAAWENATTGGALAIISLIIVVIAAALIIAWIIFPFIVISKFNELLKVARELANDFDDARKRLKTVAENLEACHRALNESNRALQWIVDEKGKEK
jgi:hypothetical protein